MIAFTKRNLKLFFRDRSAVFFSLMAVFIVVGLYVLFLGDVWTGSLSELEDASTLMNCWIVAGLLIVTSVTTVLGALGMLVDDRALGMIKDFSTAPVKSGVLTMGYIVSTVCIGMVMSLVTLVLGEVFLYTQGASLLAPVKVLEVIGIVFLSTLSNTAMLLFLVSFFKSTKAFGTASTIIGTLIGFLTGIYLPIGQLPDAVQTVVKCFPPSHSAALLRQIFMEDQLEISLASIPAEYVAEYRQEFSEMMGVTYSFGEKTLENWVSVVILLAAAVIFFALTILVHGKRKTK